MNDEKSKKLKEFDRIDRNFNSKYEGNNNRIIGFGSNDTTMHMVSILFLKGNSKKKINFYIFFSNTAEPVTYSKNGLSFWEFIQVNFISFKNLKENEQKKFRLWVEDGLKNNHRIFFDKTLFEIYDTFKKVNNVLLL